MAAEMELEEILDKAGPEMRDIARAIYDVGVEAERKRIRQEHGAESREEIFQEGQNYERKRIRKRILDAVRRISFAAGDCPHTGEVVVLKSELLAAIDRVCPERT